MDRVKMDEIRELLKRCHDGDIILHAPIAARLKDECGFLLSRVEELTRENEKLKEDALYWQDQFQKF